MNGNAGEASATAALDQEPRSPLQRLVALARRSDAAAIAADAEALATRIAENRFYVAVLGQFKRGKSTLVNALLGEAVLPVGVVPVTTVVTVIRHGEERAARVRFEDDHWHGVEPATLAEYVSEERNPGNQKRVVGIEVFHPSPLLASGLCLVDTPGVGSVFSGATAATTSFVPHIDAALIVIGGDPPLSGDEAVLAESVSK